MNKKSQRTAPGAHSLHHQSHNKVTLPIHTVNTEMK